MNQSMHGVLAKLVFGMLAAVLVLAWLVWTFQDAGSAIRSHIGPHALLAPVHGGMVLGGDGARDLLQQAIRRVQQALPLMSGLLATVGIAMVLVPARWAIRARLLTTGLVICALSLTILLPLIWPWVAQGT